MKSVSWGFSAAVALLLSILSIRSFAETQDCRTVYEHLKSKRQEDVIALPHTGAEMDGMFATHQVCFQGEDVTTWAVGRDMELTSGYNGFVQGSFVAIVTARDKYYNEKLTSLGNPRSTLILLRVASDSKSLERTELLVQKVSDDPTKLLEDFRLAGYDSFNKIVYFEVPAWATASAVHAFAFAPVLRGEKPSVRYVGPGSVEWVMTETGLKSSQYHLGKVLMWQQEVVPGIGRREFLYAFDATGKRLCRVSTASDYRINPACVAETSSR